MLSNALAENNLTLPIGAITQLERYLDCLSRWNRVFNLTAIAGRRERVYLHLIDSLLVIPYLQGERMLDVGSGAGLPGIPLAIALPNTQWTLLDKTLKKTTFLNQVVSECDLKNVKIIHSRCEDFQPEGKFDTVISRAVGSVKQLIIMSRHLIAEQGRIIAMKGRDVEAELHGLPPGFTVTVTPLKIQGIERERQVVICQSIPVANENANFRLPSSRG